MHKVVRFIKMQNVPERNAARRCCGLTKWGRRGAERQPVHIHNKELMVVTKKHTHSRESGRNLMHCDGACQHDFGERM